jgi:hypothetical protein
MTRELAAPQAQSSLCIGMDAVEPFRNAWALDHDKAEHYKFFAVTAVVQRAIKPVIEKASEIQDCLQRGEALGASESGVLLQAIRASQYRNRRSFVLSGPAWDAHTFHQI